MNLTILTFREDTDLMLHRAFGAYFGKYSHYDFFAMPYCIVLGEDSDIKVKLGKAKPVALSAKISKNRFGFYQELDESEVIDKLQEELGLEKTDTGLFLGSEGKKSVPLEFNSRLIPHRIMRIRYEYPYSDVIEQRIVSSDKAY